jgi:ABC-2 type transport system permease protein
VWGLVVFSIVAGPMFGPSLHLPSWLLSSSPFTHVPNAPAAAVTLAPVLALSVTGVVIALVSAAVVRSRDLSLPA